MNASKLSVAAMIVAGSIALSGCGKGGATPTTISYHEIGVCKSYDRPTGIAQAQTDEGFAIFKIETVDNTKNGSLFNLDPERFYVDQSNAEQKKKSVDWWNRRFVNPDPRFAQAMGVKNLEQAALPAGQKRDADSFILVTIGTNNPTGGPDADQYNLNLAYDTGSSENQKSINQGILFQKTNPPDSKYLVVESCKELALN